MPIFYFASKPKNNYLHATFFTGIKKYYLVFLILFAYGSIWAQSQSPTISPSLVEGTYVIPSTINSIIITVIGGDCGDAYEKRIDAMEDRIRDSAP